MSTENTSSDFDYLPEEKRALLRRDIGSRLKLLATAKTPEKKRFEALEAVTGVPAATWRTWWRRGTSPSGTLIESAATAWPEHGFWLATGLTDVEAGHNVPYPPPASIKPYLDVFPESPFSAASLAEEHSSWAVVSEYPDQGMSLVWGKDKDGNVNVQNVARAGLFKWPTGAKQLLDATAEYLRISRDLQHEYWSDRANRMTPAPVKMQTLESARMKAREVRWTKIKTLLKSK